MAGLRRKLNEYNSRTSYRDAVFTSSQSTTHANGPETRAKRKRDAHAATPQHDRKRLRYLDIQSSAEITSSRVPKGNIADLEPVVTPATPRAAPQATTYDCLRR